MDAIERNKGGSSSDAQFIRTEDSICLGCSHEVAMGHSYLVGLWRHCYVEPQPEAEEPCNIYRYMLVIDDAISVHALQGWTDQEKQSGQRIVLYGQAILMRHAGTKKLLRCLSTQTANDKKSYQIGFRQFHEKSDTDASCWFTVHPASKQRSEGEKVQAGDEVFLINVATQRYLSLLTAPQTTDLGLSIDFESYETIEMAVASYYQIPWSLTIVTSGSAKEESIGYVNGGDIIQLLCRHGKGECLSVSSPIMNKANLLKDNPYLDVQYEGGTTCKELRSLWKVELFPLKFGGAFTAWGQRFRLRHMTSGKYLGIIRDAQRLSIKLVDQQSASVESTAFCFTTAKNPSPPLHKDPDGMGSPQIKFGDAEVFLRHADTGRWVGSEDHRQVMGKRRRHSNYIPKAVLMQEPKQRATLSLTRVPHSRGILSATSFFMENNIRRYLNALGLTKNDDDIKEEADEKVEEEEWRKAQSLAEEIILPMLKDMLYMLQPPDKVSLAPRQYHEQLSALRENQMLFQKQGLVLIVFAAIQAAAVHYSTHPSSVALDVLFHFCKLLAALVRGNKDSSQQFATSRCDALMKLLEIPKLTHAVLDMIQCLFEDNPEVICSISEKHIADIVHLLHHNGQDEKVMQLLGVLCVCQGVAIREKQQLVCKHLLQARHLFLHTTLHHQIHCLHANVFIDNNRMARVGHRWYYEVHIQLPCNIPHLRVGWAHYQLFSPHPSSNGTTTTSGGLGDDLSSVGFDGENVWFEGNAYSTVHTPKSHRHKLCRQVSHDLSSPPSQRVRIIGCFLEMEKREVWFSLDGKELRSVRTRSSLDAHSMSTVVVPAVSYGGGEVNAKFHLGGPHGELRYQPPGGFSPLCEAAEHEKKGIFLDAFERLGCPKDLILCGPKIVSGQVPFTALPIDTSQVTIPRAMQKLVDELAENIHENWSKSKISQGYTYNEASHMYDEERNNELKLHPMLRPFKMLSPEEQLFNRKMASELVKTLLVLGCSISSSDGNEDNTSRLHEEFTEDYRQSNGYKPSPLRLQGHLDTPLLSLVDRLAENTHTVWAAERIQNGWTYGPTDRDKARRSNKLLPFSLLSKADRESNKGMEKDNLLTILALGYHIHPPPIGQIREMKSVSHIPFRTFRGQFASYCSKRGKWYFKVKLIKGRMMRVGWATPGFSPSQVLGADNFSYAIDGYQTCKWHSNGSEKFGNVWKKGDVVGCLIDLDQQTMLFTHNGRPLQDMSGDIVAFKGFPRDQIYVPAVTVFLGEKIQLILNQTDDDMRSYFQEAGYEAISKSIKRSVPIWYSTKTPIFETLTPSHPSLFVVESSSPDTISLGCKEMNQQYCIRLNMGVTISPTPASSTLSVHLRPGPLSPTSEQDIAFKFAQAMHTHAKVSFSIRIPLGTEPSHVFVGWTTPVFKDVFRQTTSIDETHINDVMEVLQQGVGEDEWEMTKKISTSFLVQLSKLLPENNSIQEGDIVSCILDTNSGEMTFSYTECEAPIILTVDTSCKLFPTLITTTKQEQLGDFIFTPVEGCQPLSSLLVPAKMVSAASTHPPPPPLLPAMKLTVLMWSCWRQLQDGLVASSIPAPATPMVSPTASMSTLSLATSLPSAFFSSLPSAPFSVPIPVPHCTSNMLLAATLPQVEKVMWLSEIVEQPKLLSFHLETLKTLRSMCLHGNTDAAKQVEQLVDWDQLLQLVSSSRWDYNMRAAYFNLLNTLHLEHQVYTRQLIQGDYIFAVNSTPIQKSDRTERRPSLQEQSLISHEITSSFTSCRLSSKLQVPLKQLKEVVFSTLESINRDNAYSCRMLNSFDRADILVPLLTAVNSFLVLGMMGEKKDRQRLLALLHPSWATLGQEGACCSKTAASLLTLTQDEPIKIIVCDLLKHLCDCQLESRVEHVVRFAENYVMELQQDQEKRGNVTDQLSAKVMRELRTPSNKQLAALLSFNDTPSPECLTDPVLRDSLLFFHSHLRKHLGAGTKTVEVRMQDMSTADKLEKLAKLVASSFKKKPPEHEEEWEGQLESLRRVIVATLIKWARQGTHNQQLTEKLFYLLYRQFNQTEELVQALTRTYVIEEEDGLCSADDISKFQHALGQVRVMLMIGLGPQEEQLLEHMLKQLRQSALFARHPDLMRLTGVHTTVMNVIKTYLNYSSSLQQNDSVLHVKQKIRLSMSKDGFVGPVEECCKFLCEFALTSPQNQAALFDHVEYLLDQSKQHPARLSSPSCSPLDVATATIEGNMDLALALKEELLEEVVLLMEMMTILPEGGGSMTRSRSFTAQEWAPAGSEKCLKFLQAAVWVQGEPVTHTAGTVVRLLIQHPICLGPGYGDTLGLEKSFRSSLLHLNAPQKSSSMHRQGTIVSVLPAENEETDSHHLLRRNTSNLTLNYVTAELTLSFYTALIRLLASCAPVIDHNSSSSSSSQMAEECIRSFLKSLVTLNELKNILSLPLADAEGKGISPIHKQAILMFLDHVYEIKEPEFVLDLLRDVFLPDIRLALKKHLSGEFKQLISHYMCEHALSFLQRHSFLLPQLVSHLSLLTDFMVYCYELASSAHMVSFHGGKITNFLKTMSRSLPPQAILKLIPLFLADTNTLPLRLQLIGVKVLTAHYDHYSRFYTMGMLTSVYKLSAPSRQEKSYIALLYNQLLKAYSAKPPKEKQLVLSCMQSLACALAPDCLVPDMSDVPEISSSTDFTIMDTSSVNLSPDLLRKVEEFAVYCHDKWVYEQQSFGYTYGPVVDDKMLKHPHVCPFKRLSDEHQEQLKKPARQCLEILLACGCLVTHSTSSRANSVPNKPQMVCIRRPKNKKRGSIVDSNEWQYYEATVMDLNKVEAPIEFQIIAESAARLIYDAKTTEHERSDSVPQPQLMRFVSVKEDEHKKLFDFVMEFMKFLKVKGLVCSGTFVPLAGNLQQIINCPQSNLEPFATQIFQLFLNCVEQGTVVSQFQPQMLCSSVSAHLHRHASYFNLSAACHCSKTVCECERRPSYASTSEKVQIARILFLKEQFIFKHAKMFYPVPKKATAITTNSSSTSNNSTSNSSSPTSSDSFPTSSDSFPTFSDSFTTSSNTFASPSDSFSSSSILRRRSSGVAKSNGHQASTASESNGAVVSASCELSYKQILTIIKNQTMIMTQSEGTLSSALIRAIDITEQQVLNEISAFFAWSVKVVAGTTAHLDLKKDPSELAYVLFLLCPELTALFSQFECDCAAKDHTHIHVDVSVVNKWCSIFNSLYTAARKHTSVLIDSGTLATIGKCLGTLTRVSPIPTGDDVFGHKMADLIDEVRTAAAERLSSDRLTLVACVTVPVVVGVLKSIPRDSKSQQQIDSVLKLVLRVIMRQFGQPDTEWLLTLAAGAHKLAAICSSSILKTHLLPLLQLLSKKGTQLWQQEKLLTSSLSVREDEVIQRQQALSKELHIFARDFVSFLPFLYSFINQDSKQERLWLEGCLPPVTYQIYDLLGCMTTSWISSQRLRVQVEFECQKYRNLSSSQFDANDDRHVAGHSNLLLACAEQLLWRLPRNYRLLVDRFYDQYGQRGVSLSEIEQDIVKEITARCPSTVKKKSKLEYDLLDDSAEDNSVEVFHMSCGKMIQKIAGLVHTYSRIKHYIFNMNSSASTSRSRWRELFTQQRRKAIIECLRAVPFFKLKKHRAVNMFLQEYSASWLGTCKQPTLDALCEILMELEDRRNTLKRNSGQLVKHRKILDPLAQLFDMFNLQASQQGLKTGLYLSYTNTIVQNSQWLVEEEEGMDSESTAKAYELFHWRLARLSEKQEQLLSRGAASVILTVIASSKGVMVPAVHSTLQLGIVMLEGGNEKVQQRMLDELKKRDTQFLTSMAALISSCSVLDWAAYERHHGILSTNQHITDHVFQASDQITDLFRFLQLLCEGHNEMFQNQLRTQERNTTTVNIVVATVDYLLRLQESIRDFYWHQAHHDSIGQPARNAFLTSFRVTKQVFRTLTEYIQGPCEGNQMALAHSRLWDAVSGFLHIFDCLQKQLYRHTSHVELLREMLDLQEVFFILLLSLLEGSTIDQCIAGHMVDMLQESMQHVKELIVFYHIFIKLKDVASSTAFREYDLNKDGFISYQEFENAMLAQQHYTKSEIDYLMQCADTNKDGLLDYREFIERFHKPVHNLGFHLCALIKQLSDILPSEPRLGQLREACRELSRHFENGSGCIEILGKSGRVERVYFPVRHSRAVQWSEQHIQESREQFFHSVGMSSQKEKLNGFVGFCEDTIFEMNYSDCITGGEQEEKERRAEAHMKEHSLGNNGSTRSLRNRLRTYFVALEHSKPRHPVFRLRAFLTAMWFTILCFIIVPSQQAAKFIRLQLAFLWHKGEGPLHPSSLPPLSPTIINLVTYTNYLPSIAHSLRSWSAILASNYYRLRKLLLVITMFVNILLLMFKSQPHDDDELEMVSHDLLPQLMEWLTLSHFALSIILIFSYWNLKVPLIIFKREKKIARKLELESFYTLESEREGWFEQWWDSIVVKSPSFPQQYWDKQVKWRLWKRAEPHRRAQVAEQLGITTGVKIEKSTKCKEVKDLLSSIINFRYRLWELGVVFTDMKVLYHVLYCFISLAGIRWNIFYFSIHLIDLMMESKVLLAILRSVLINARQLLMTLFMTGTVIFIYTVIAFNFFRKFYRTEGELRDHCESMWRCFLFHLDQGLRSGGGIADVLMSASGDQQEFLRLLFDMTFFFFVIVILLAIIQGLIIDAFGELRKKDDMVNEELKNKCFVCGISKTEFDNSQGYENHITQHHAMKNYLFFLMHLIRKQETEFTGQESYVWEHYLQQRWDFFPSGTCFQLQGREKLKRAQPSHHHHAPSANSC